MGNFIEVEAIDTTGSLGIEKLKEQVNKYADYFNIRPFEYIADSYSDIILQGLKQSTKN
ncbi:MAG: hypothetical protein WKF59_22255 [Chitinophagaceae bacterium]